MFVISREKRIPQCKRCKGNGLIGGYTCGECNGTGLSEPYYEWEVSTPRELIASVGGLFGGGLLHIVYGFNDYVKTEDMFESILEAKKECKRRNKKEKR